MFPQIREPVAGQQGVGEQGPNGQVSNVGRRGAVLSRGACFR
jgi:hypothetical protein